MGTHRSNICLLTDEQYNKITQDDIFEGLSYGVVDDNNEEFADGAVGDLGYHYPDYIQMPDYGLLEYYDFANKHGRIDDWMLSLNFLLVYFAMFLLYF